MFKWCALACPQVALRLYWSSVNNIKIFITLLTTTFLQMVKPISESRNSSSVMLLSCRSLGCSTDLSHEFAEIKEVLCFKSDWSVGNLKCWIYWTGWHSSLLGFKTGWTILYCFSRRLPICSQAYRQDSKEVPSSINALPNNIGQSGF